MANYSYLLENNACKKCGTVLHDPNSVAITAHGVWTKTHIDDEGSMFYMFVADPSGDGNLINTDPQPVIECGTCGAPLPFAAVEE